MSYYVSVVAVAKVMTSWIIAWTDLFDFFQLSHRQDRREIAEKGERAFLGFLCLPLFRLSVKMSTL